MQDSLTHVSAHKHISKHLFKIFGDKNLPNFSDHKSQH